MLTEIKNETPANEILPSPILPKTLGKMVMNRIEAVKLGFERIEKEWQQLEYIGSLTLKRLNINIPKYQEDDFIPKDNKEYPQDAP